MAAESPEPSNRDEFDELCEVGKELRKLDFESHFPNAAPPTELETIERLQMNVAIPLGLTGIAGALGFLAPPAGLAFGCIVFGLGLFLKE